MFRLLGSLDEITLGDSGVVETPPLKIPQWMSDKGSLVSRKSMQHGGNALCTSAVENPCRYDLLCSVDSCSATHSSC
eukprot:3432116-Amphidinium_carterae.1